MKLGPAPSVATWFLKLFCSDVEYEALVGDLTEQYQQALEIRLLLATDPKTLSHA